MKLGAVNQWDAVNVLGILGEVPVTKEDMDNLDKGECANTKVVAFLLFLNEVNTGGIG